MYTVIKYNRPYMLKPQWRGVTRLNQVLLLLLHSLLLPSPFKNMNTLKLKPKHIKCISEMWKQTITNLNHSLRNKKTHGQKDSLDLNMDLMKLKLIMFRGQCALMTAGPLDLGTGHPHTRNQCVSWSGNYPLVHCVHKTHINNIFHLLRY